MQKRTIVTALTAGGTFLLIVLVLSLLQVSVGIPELAIAAVVVLIGTTITALLMRHKRRAKLAKSD